MDRQYEKRIHHLAAKLCDSEATELEVAELGRLLDGNQPGILEYLDLTRVEFHLRNKSWIDLKAESKGVSVREMTPQPLHVPAGVNSLVGVYRKSRGLFLFGLAASVLFVSAMLLRVLLSDVPYVARITEIIDCDWSTNRWETKANYELSKKDRVKFQEGLMLIEFGSGAKVILEGPVEFQVIGDNSATLEYGRLCASVPTQAIGFAVETPFAEIVDLSTCFGVSVKDNGDCETHVFEGKVAVQGRLVNNRSSQILQAHNALRVSGSGHEWQKLPAVPASFAGYSLLESIEDIATFSRLGIDSDPIIKCWLRADAQIEVDGNKRVVRWPDESLQQQLSCDAWQLEPSLRPILVVENETGHRTIRFDGSNVLSTPPLSLGKDFSLMCVIRGRETMVQPFPQRLINIGDQNSLVIERPRVDLLAGSLLLGGKHPTNKAGYVASSDFDLSGSIVCAYIYSSTVGQAQLFINGELVGTTKAPMKSIGSSPLTVGGLSSQANGFVGDIYELIVFDQSFNPEECRNISRALMDQYGITSSLREPRVLSGVRTSDN